MRARQARPTAIMRGANHSSKSGRNYISPSEIIRMARDDVNPIATFETYQAKADARAASKSDHMRFVHLCGGLELFLGGYVLDRSGDLRGRIPLGQFVLPRSVLLDGPFDLLPHIASALPFVVACARIGHIAAHALHRVRTRTVGRQPAHLQAGGRACHGSPALAFWLPEFSTTPYIRVPRSAGDVWSSQARRSRNTPWFLRGPRPCSSVPVARCSAPPERAARCCLGA